MVRSARLELARVAPPPPQDGVSANSTTTACFLDNRGLPCQNSCREIMFLSIHNRNLEVNSVFLHPERLFSLLIIGIFLWHVSALSHCRLKACFVSSSRKCGDRVDGKFQGFVTITDQLRLHIFWFSYIFHGESDKLLPVVETHRSQKKFFVIGGNR